LIQLSDGRSQTSWHVNGVEVLEGVAFEAIEQVGNRLALSSTGKVYATADLVLVAAGVQPNSALASAAGVAPGSKGTSGWTGAWQPTSRISMPLATASRPGTVSWATSPTSRLERRPQAGAGSRVRTFVGGTACSRAPFGTQVVKVFDLAMARTGFRDREAGQAGFDPLTVETGAWDHKAYYPGARQLRLRVTGDRRTGRLLGGQLLGAWQAESS